MACHLLLCVLFAVIVTSSDDDTDGSRVAAPVAPRSLKKRQIKCAARAEKENDDKESATTRTKHRAGLRQYQNFHFCRGLRGMT